MCNACRCSNLKIELSLQKNYLFKRSGHKGTIVIYDKGCLLLKYSFTIDGFIPLFPIPILDLDNNVSDLK